MLQFIVEIRRVNNYLNLTNIPQKMTWTKKPNHAKMLTVLAAILSFLLLSTLPQQVSARERRKSPPIRQAANSTYTSIMGAKPSIEEQPTHHPRLDQEVLPKASRRSKTTGRRLQPPEGGGPADRGFTFEADTCEEGLLEEYGDTSRINFELADENVRDRAIFACCEHALDWNEYQFYESDYYACACEMFKIYEGPFSTLYSDSNCDEEPYYETRDCDLIGEVGDYGYCFSDCDAYTACYCITYVSKSTMVFHPETQYTTQVWFDDPWYVNPTLTTPVGKIEEQFYREDIIPSSDVVVTLTIPVTSYVSERCDFCQISDQYDPCSDVFGDGPIDVYDCFGEVCPKYNTQCDNLLTPSFALSDPYAIVDNNMNMCPQVSTIPKIYKPDIAEGVEPSNVDCYQTLTSIIPLYADVTNFENYFYLSLNVVNSICGFTPPCTYDGTDNCIDEVYDQGCEEIPWIENTVSQIYDLVSDDNVGECFTFQENLSQIGHDQNPCLAYYDDENQICALCKMNSARILVTGRGGNKFVVCGSVRKPERDSDGVYEFLDPETVAWDSIANQDYQCYVHPYYEQLASAKALYEYDSTQQFYPQKYLNVTDEIEEYLCLDTSEYLEEKYCRHDGIKPTQQQLDNETEDTDEIQLSLVPITIGCSICRDGSIPTIEYDNGFGIFVQGCQNADEFDFTDDNVPCSDIGYVQQWTGYITEEQTLTCELCQDLIPNCLVCETADACTMCKAGYYETNVYDSDGVPHLTCLRSFCGLDGMGATCVDKESDQLEGCRKFSQVSITENAGTKQAQTLYFDSCSICEPDYYSVIYGLYLSAAEDIRFLKKCVLQEGSITKNFFIRPELSTFFTDNKQNDMYDKFYEQDGGQRWDQPFYFLQNAFSLIGDKNGMYQGLAADFEIGGDLDTSKNEYPPYTNFEEVTFNIWLLKGTHHFVQCEDYLEPKYPDQDKYYDFYDIEADAFFVSPGDYAEEDLKAFSTLCKNAQTYFPLKKQEQRYDNVKYYVRPLECKLAKSTFKKMSEFGNEDVFYENCVDLERGDPKPQLRVHGNAMFNITNFAQFENIEFTAVDNMIELEATDGQAATLEKYQDFIKSSPFKLCDFEEEPTGFLEDAVFIERETGDDNFSITCTTGFNATLDGVAEEIDQECVTEKPTEPQGVRSCQGEPPHETFFEKSLYSVDVFFHQYLSVTMTYPYRHNVLFNLYAFDAVHSNRTHAPTLNLIDCDFTYFIDKQALIQVENNNYVEMATVVAEGVLNFDQYPASQDLDEIDSQFMAKLGEDRGARIDIDGCTFKHSRFCKGMISYREVDPISYDDAPQLVRFDKQTNRTVVEDEDEATDDGRAESFIRIKDSHFENLAYHQKIEVLSNLKNSTSVCGGTEQSQVFGCVFELYDHRGFVINAKGYNGTIQIEGTTFERNMAYIKDYLIIERMQTDEYLKPSTVQYSIFEDGLGQLSFKVCDEAYRGIYFVNSFIDSRETFDDGAFAQQYESISTIMLIANKGPLIIQNCTFSENIGTVGGAIHVMSPDFESNANLTSVNQKPYMLIKDNIFKQNMAYFAGNALYMAHTVNRFTSWQDYRNSCGAGVFITGNLFLENNGLKKHNGGVAVHRCFQLFMETSLFAATSQTSSLPLLEREKGEDEEGDFEFYYEHPQTTYDTITDIYDDSITYEVKKHATVYEFNTFKLNASGMAGSAIVVSQLTEFELISNLFDSNGPILSMKEFLISPYVKYLALYKKSLTYGLPASQCDRADNEIQYYQECYDPLFFTDSPALKGAVYIENCESVSQCFFPLTDSDASDLLASGQTKDDILQLQLDFVEQHEHGLIRMQSKIEKNHFRENQILPILQYTQTDQQASCLYIKGGTNHIASNTFQQHYFEQTEILTANAPKIYEFAPTGYFEMAQGPLIYIRYEELFSDEVGGQLDIFDTFLDDNYFYNNTNVQGTLLDNSYRASLVEYISRIPQATFNFQSNVVEYNAFLGAETSLIAIDGGVFTISNNTLRNNGYLSVISLQKHPDSVNTTSNWPYSQYVFQYAQAAGVFSFYFENNNIPAGKAHLIKNNTFSHIYCLSGCAYKAQGNKLHQISFDSNTYAHMVAQQGGSVFDGSNYMQPTVSKTKFHLHTFINETVTHTAGGAILIKNMNQAGVTLFIDCTFRGNYGTDGGSILMQEGGALIAINVEFTLDAGSNVMPETLSKIIKAKEWLDSSSKGQETKEINDETIEGEEESYSFSEHLLESFTGTEAQFSFLIHPDSLKLTESIVNIEGQVLLIENYIDNEFGNIEVVVLGTTLKEYLAKYTSERETQNTANVGSLFQDCRFADLFGENTSAVTIWNTIAVFKSSRNEKVHFENNLAPTGSTITVRSGSISLSKIRMEKNAGAKGGCIYLSMAELDVFKSSFVDNVALQGGVIFSISNSAMRVTNSILERNIAKDGGVLYGMSNQLVYRDEHYKFISVKDENGNQEPSLGFLSSVIRENWAESNLIHILLSKLLIRDCEMADNYAQFVTHGITLISSELLVESTKIHFTEAGLAKVHSLSLDKLDTGFFNLYLESSLTLSKKTVVQNMTGQKMAVLTAISQSSVYTESDVLFIDNNTANKDGFTMKFENTKEILLADSRFIGNGQINIMVVLSDLQLVNCTFTSGSKNHIQAISSSINFDRVTIADSESLTSLGHGLNCLGCLDINIKDSVFRNLTALTGAAISIESSESQSHTVIEGSVFEGNTALQAAGAVHLNHARSVTFKGNRFTENKVEGMATGWRFRDAGAIYFRCFPVDGEYPCDAILDSNLFERNSAENKGGAMRYINTNFTTVFEEAGSGRRLLSKRSLQDSSQVGEDTNTYLGNVAVYGNDIASYPKGYMYTFTQNGNRYSLNETDYVEIAPGQVLDLTVEIFDQEGRLCEDENDAVCTLEFVSGQNLADGSVIVNQGGIAYNGTIVFEALQIRQTPNTDTKFNLLFTTLKLFSNPVERFDDPVAHVIHARTCQQGETYGEALTCLPCEPGFRLYEAQLEPGTCDECLETENCFGSNQTSPKPTYWRSYATSTNYLKCFNPDACLGSGQESPLGDCKEGYGGIMCANCVGRFRRQGAFECEECSSLGVNIFISVLYILILLSAVIILVRTSMRGSNQRRPLSSVYIKIFLNHFQILQVVSTINFGWPPLIQMILNFQKFIVTLPTEVISFDCLLIDFVTGPDPDLRFNYIRITFFYALPVLVILISYLFWLCKGKLSNLTQQQRVDKTISTIAIVWFLFYPTIVSYLAKSINCTKIEDTYRLYDDLEEECFQGKHLNIIYAISIPGLFCWAFGVPILGLVTMRHFLKEIASKKFLSDPKFSNDLHKRFKLRLGFLTQGYKEELYFWEIVLLLRKTLLVLMLTFLAPVSAGVQSLSAILLLIFSLVFQIKFEPFYAKQLNDMEVTSITVQIIVIYFGLFYQSSKNESFVQSNGTMYTFFFLVAIVSAQFIGLFCVRMRMEVLKATVNHHKCCFRLFNCRQIKNEETFKKEHKVGNIVFEDEVKITNVEAQQSAQSARSARSARQSSRQDDSVVDPSHVKLSYRERIQLKRERDRIASSCNKNNHEQSYNSIGMQSSQSDMGGDPGNVTVSEMYHTVLINTTNNNLNGQSSSTQINDNTLIEVPRLKFQDNFKLDQSSSRSILKNSMKRDFVISSRKDVQVSFRQDMLDSAKSQQALEVGQKREDHLLAKSARVKKNSSAREMAKLDLSVIQIDEKSEESGENTNVLLGDISAKQLVTQLASRQNSPNNNIQMRKKPLVITEEMKERKGLANREIDVKSNGSSEPSDGIGAAESSRRSNAAAESSRRSNAAATDTNMVSSRSKRSGKSRERKQRNQKKEKESAELDSSMAAATATAAAAESGSNRKRNKSPNIFSSRKSRKPKLIIAEKQ